MTADQRVKSSCCCSCCCDIVTGGGIHSIVPGLGHCTLLQICRALLSVGLFSPHGLYDLSMPSIFGALITLTCAMPAAEGDSVSSVSGLSVHNNQLWGHDAASISIPSTTAAASRGMSSPGALVPQLGATSQAGRRPLLAPLPSVKGGASSTVSQLSGNPSTATAGAVWQMQDSPNCSCNPVSPNSSCVVENQLLLHWLITKFHGLTSTSTCMP